MPKVISVEHVNCDEYVYDPCCSYPNHYLGNGFIHHNCVCWVSEFDKSLSGCSTSRSDGGVMQRLFGKLLVYMTERSGNESKAFFIATANDISQLPSEITRHGRWDAVFFLNLPSTCERKEIWSVLLKKVKRDPLKFDLDKLSYMTEGYTGAEIESIIKDAMVEAFDKRIGGDKTADINTELLLAAKSKINPLSHMQKDIIDFMKLEAEKRGYLVANSPDNIGDEFHKEMAAQDDMGISMG